jgi:hypothetical protein
MPSRITPRPLGREYVDLVVRAFAARMSSPKSDGAGKPAPPVARFHSAMLFKLHPGVSVQVWFTRNTPSKIPALRVGVVFDTNRREANASIGDAFFARYASELTALGAEHWRSDSDNDRRYMTPLPCAAGTNLSDLAKHAATLAAHYVELLKRTGAIDLNGANFPCRTQHIQAR